jgi:hypothetical protein
MTSQHVTLGSGSGPAPTSVQNIATECPTTPETPAKRRYSVMARGPIPRTRLMGRAAGPAARKRWHILDVWGTPFCGRVSRAELVDERIYDAVRELLICKACWGRFSWQPVAHDTELIDLGYETPCRVWTRGTQGAGYGSRGLDGKNRLTHREAFEQEHGAIPEGHVLHHLCGQKRCLEVDHMVAISRAEHCKIHRPGDHRVYG